jgi:hypothetical protein
MLQKKVLLHLKRHGPARQEGLQAQFGPNEAANLDRALRELIAWKLVTLDVETAKITALGVQTLSNPTYWE